jgi:hypothetical protein
MGYARPTLAACDLPQMRFYPAITRYSDGRIIHMRNIRATSDAEAIRVVTAKGSTIRIDLWSDRGLVRRSGEN